MSILIPVCASALLALVLLVNSVVSYQVYLGKQEIIVAQDDLISVQRQLIVEKERELVALRATVELLQTRLR